jgi:hypothetical protein
MRRRKKLFPMARHSILAPARAERASAIDPEPIPPETPQRGERGTRVSRRSKLHIGGYFDPRDPTVIAFQKLRVDLRKSQQEMLFEALHDFVAKYQAQSAFGQ